MIKIDETIIKKADVFLGKCRKIIETEKKMNLLKKDSFNIFSIIRMETKEDIVHSRFIGELLNPKGRHQKGNTFLKLFLKTIQFDELSNKSFDTDHCTRTIEKNIGKRNERKQVGGRIDLYLSDEKGNSISIENKIYAGDQNVQIARYVNHNKDKNTVYYLTLWGGEPSHMSKGEKKGTKEEDHVLQSGRDYHCISYKEHILHWLNSCVREAYDYPILRENIRQYITLIEKLTEQMDKKAEKDFQELILTNYTSVMRIREHEARARREFRKNIRNEVLKALKEHPDKRLHNAELGNKVSQNHSQIFFRIHGKKDGVLDILTEGYGERPHHDGQMTIFILNPYPHNSLYINEEHVNANGKWSFNHKKLERFNGFETNLKRSKTIEKLSTDTSFRKDFVVNVVEQIHQYFNEEYDGLMAFMGREQ